MKSISKFAALCLLVPLGFSICFGWGNATHVYFSNCLGVKIGPLNQNEMYGSVLPDLFNLDPSASGLATAFHFDTELMMRAYLNAPTREAKAAAYGFITHNNVWGADFTAHDNGRTVGNKGWVIVYAEKLEPTIEPYVTDLLGSYLSPADLKALSLTMAHDLVETAVDVLVKRSMDPLVGGRLYLSAKMRSSAVPEMLAEALSSAISRDQFIQAEESYREGMMMYGQLFMLPDQQMITEIGNLNASVATDYLKAVTGISVIIDPTKVVEFLGKAIDLVRPYYRQELLATLVYVEKEMLKHHVTPAGPVFALFREDGLEGQIRQTGSAQEKPTAFSLDQNYPNPFNPSTTISFSLPADGHVLLKVFNSLGQEVVTLVNEQKAAGEHQVNWYAANLPSGIYFYRIDTQGFVETKRMTLVK